MVDVSIKSLEKSSIRSLYVNADNDNVRFPFTLGYITYKSLTRYI